MLKTFFIFVSISVIALCVFKPAPVFANGKTQQLQVASQGGTMYLTTNVQSNGNATAGATVATTNSAASTNALAGQITPPLGFIANITDLINLLLRVVFVVAALLVFGFLIIGALQWITSGGEKSKTEAARNKIVAAIIGLIIVVSSFAIMTLIVRILGFNDLNGVLSLLTTNSDQTASSSSQIRQQNLVP